MGLMEIQSTVTGYIEIIFSQSSQMHSSRAQSSHALLWKTTAAHGNYDDAVCLMCYKHLFRNPELSLLSFCFM